MGGGTGNYGGVTTIEDYAFAGSTLTNVTIPGSVTSVGSRIFYGTSKGTVTLQGRTAVPSSWSSTWAYNSSGQKWTIHDTNGAAIS